MFPRQIVLHVSKICPDATATREDCGDFKQAADATSRRVTEGDGVRIGPVDVIYESLHETYSVAE